MREEIAAGRQVSEVRNQASDEGGRPFQAGSQGIKRKAGARKQKNEGGMRKEVRGRAELKQEARKPG